MAAKPNSTIDYQALLASDPVLQATLRAISGQGAQDQIALSEARNRALTQYGAVPDASVLGGLAPDITDVTRGLASDATASGLSTLGQLHHGYEQQQGGDIASLAGRGLLRSGAYRQHSMENLQGLQTGEANAQTGLLDSLSGLWSGYQGQQQQNAQQAQGATSDALSRVVGQINAGTISGAPAPPRPRKPRPVSSLIGHQPLI